MRYIKLVLLLGSWFFLLTSPKLSAQTFSGQGNMPVPTPPQNMFGLTVSPVTVSGVGILGGCFQVESVTINLTTPLPQGLNFILVSPSGTMLELASMCGGFSGQNFTDCTFTDYGAEFITSAYSPATGNWRPEGRNNTPPWSNNWPDLGTYTFNNTFNGTNANGLWSLMIESNAWAGPIQLLSWSLTFGTNQPTGNSLSPSSCNTGGGLGTFNLSSLSNSISPTGFPVAFYANPAATNLIGNPSSFSTPSTTVYAVVQNPPCNSDPIPIPLNVTNTPLPQGAAFSLTPSSNCGPILGTWNFNFGSSLYYWEYTAVSPSFNQTSALSTPLGNFSNPYNFTEDLVVTINYVTDAITGCEYSFSPMSDTFDLIDPPSLSVVQPPAPCVGNPVNLANSVTSNASTVTYHSASPPTSANEVNPNIVQTIPGVYTYYVVASSGSGCSQTIPMTYQVMPASTPLLTSTSTCATCPPVSLTTLQDPNFPNGTWSGPGVTGNFFNPSGQSGTVSLTFTPSGVGPCITPGTTTIQVSSMACPNPASLNTCDQGGGIGTFNLNSLNSTVNGGNGAPVSYFLNSAATIPIGSPFAYSSAGGTVYAVVNGGGCPTTAVPITLTVSPTPLPPSYGISLNPTSSCVPTVGTFIWDLGPGIFIVNTTYTSAGGGSSTSTQTIASQVLPNWGCTQDHTLVVNSITNAATGCIFTFPPMSVSFDLLDSPTLTITPPLPICAGLPFDLAIAVTTNASTTTFHSATPPSTANQIPSIIAPTTPGTSIYYAVASNGSGCSVTQPISVLVLQGGTPSLGTGTMCALANPFNLTLLQDPLYPNGVWSGPGVTGTQFNPIGQSGSVTLTFTPNGSCSNPATTSIVINNPPIANPASLTTCDLGSGIGGFNLTSLNAIVNGGTGALVNYFQDINLTLLIGNPNNYLSSNTTIYASVQGSGCNSVAVPISLTVQVLSLPSATVTVNPISGCPPTTGSYVFDVGQTGQFTINYNVVTPTSNFTNSAQTDPNGVLSFPFNFQGNTTITLLGITQVSTGCIATISPSSASFTAIAAPTISVMPVSICSGQSVDLAANASSSFPLTFHTGTPANAANQLPSTTVSPTANTTYYVLATAGSGCSTTQALPVTITPSGTPILGTASACALGSNVNLTVLVDPSYPNGIWSGPGVTGNFFSPIGQTGIVTITYTPSGSCTNPATTTITITPPIPPTPASLSVCDPGSGIGVFNLTSLNLIINNNAGSVVWYSLDMAGLIPILNPSSFTSPSTTIYATVVSGCSQGVVPVTLVVEPTVALPSVASITFDPTSGCGPTPGTITVNMGTPDVYNFSATFVTPAGVIVNNSLFTQPNGIYTVPFTFTSNYTMTINSVTGSNGCSYTVPPLSASFTLNTGQPIIVNPPPAVCAGASVDLSAYATSAGPISFHTGQPANAANQISNPLVNPIISTTYYASNQLPAPCNLTLPINVSVLPSTIPSLSTANICAASGNFNLITLQDPNVPLGIWSGPGVTGSSFNPIGQNGSVVLTFTPSGGCSPAANTTITVNPSSTPVLGTSSLCSSAAPINLNSLADPNFPTGIWSGQGVSGGFFNPIGLNGPISIIFNPTANCAAISSTTINVIPAQIPNLSSAQICQSAAPLNLNTLIDPAFPIGIWSGPGVSSNTFNPIGQSGPVVLQFSTGLPCVLPGNTAINVSPVTAPNLLTAALCQNSGLLNLQTLIGSAPNIGVWSGQGVSNNFFQPNGQSGSVTLVFTPTAACTAPASTSVTVNPALQTTTPIFECQGSSTYTIGFDILGGDPAQYLVNGSPSASTFISPPITSGSTYSFLVSDQNGCGPVTLSGDYDCYCSTFSGTLQITGPQLQVCQNQSVTVVSNQNQQLDPDDILLYVLHDNSGSQLGNVLAISASPTFTFPVGASLNTPYYISVIAGTANGSGGIVLTDPCLSVSEGVPVQWYGLAVQGQVQGQVCPSDCLSAQFTTVGVPPLQLVMQIAGPTGTASDTFLLTSNTTNLSICPADYSLGIGAYQLTATQLSDPNCILALNQSLGSFQTTIASAQLQQTLCQGQSLAVGSQVFTQSNPMGSVVLANAAASGCDSIILVNLSFAPSANSSITQQLCTGGSMSVGTTLFNASQPNGIVVLPNASVFGCDSIVQVNLTFSSAVYLFYRDTLCPNQTVEIAGQTFSQLNPIGSINLPNASVLGCDSIIQVALHFQTIAMGNYTAQICPSSSIQIGNQTFNASNLSGTVILPGAAASGCDSTVQVSLSLGTAVVTNLNQTLCPGESLSVGSQVFNQANPIGTVTFPNGSVAGCDSVVQVNLIFSPAASSHYIAQICPSSSVQIGNQTFNASNLSGTVILPGAAVSGCDSTVQVSLSLGTVVVTNLNQTLCPGESLSIGNQVFNQANPIGTVTFPNGSVAGCDSVVQVNLNFSPAASSHYIAQICPSSSVQIGTQTFNASNLSGTVILPGAAASGCDSTVQVNLSLGIAVVTNLNQTLCPGESLSVGSQVFNQANPMGTVTFPNGSVAGCDSVVQVILQYHAVSTVYLNQQLCTGGSLTIGNQTFNASNPSGTVTLPGASVHGCDEIVVVDLIFGNIAINNFQASLCPDEEILIGVQTFSATNPSGSVLFPNGSYLGCDSLVQVALSFYPVAQSVYQAELCIGETYTVGNQVFSELNPTGQVVLPAATVTGCDSIVQVALQFTNMPVGNYQATLCQGETSLIGNQVFNMANPSGQVLLAGASVAGCDSLVQVQLSFTPPANSTLTQQLCPNGFVAVGTSIFDINQPSGTVILPNASYLGCDSTVQVNLSFGSAVVNDLQISLCTGETFAVGAEIFSADRLTGSVVFEQGSVFGCDSIVQVTIEMVPPAFGQLSQNLCEGDTLWLHGTAYHAWNRTGVEVFEAASVMGCDSTLQIAVQFYQANIPTYFDTLLYLTDTILINGTVYGLGYPVGEEVLQTANGCDSTVYVRVRFKQAYQIAVPNVFSPDGLVPYLSVYAGAEVAEIERFEVYNRWGELMFNRSNFAPNVPELGWDGHHRGRIMNPGVYVYVAVIRLIDGSELMLKGDIGLVR